MNWEKLLLFGSNGQIKKFDKIRQVYVNNLISKHFKPI